MRLLSKTTLLLLPVIIFLHLTLLLTTRFTAWPEMTLWPYLITKGWLPYQDIAIAHTPLLIVGLSVVYKIFGVGILQLQIFTFLIILFIDFLLFWVVKKLWNEKTAILSLSAYVLLQVFYEGNGLWFDLAFTPFVILLFYFLKTKKYLLAGVVWGLALITKQTAVWFLVPIVLTLFTFRRLPLKGKRLQSVEKFIYGILVILFTLVILLLLFGIFNDFWFWAVKFGVLYLPQAEGQVQLPTIRQFIIYLLPFAPLIFKPKLIPWVLAGFMGTYPRWGLFHFQPALPFLAMAIGLIFSKFELKQAKNYVMVLYIFLLSIMVGRQLVRDFGKETRFYESNVREVVLLITNNQSPTTSLYILNYWDNIYALTDTLPTTKPWFPYLPWYLQVPGVRNEILGDLKTDLPETIVVAVEPSYDWEDMDNVLRYYSCEIFNEKIEICKKNGF